MHLVHIGRNGRERGWESKCDGNPVGFFFFFWGVDIILFFRRRGYGEDGRVQCFAYQNKSLVIFMQPIFSGKSVFSFIMKLYWMTIFAFFYQLIQSMVVNFFSGTLKSAVWFTNVQYYSLFILAEDLLVAIWQFLWQYFSFNVVGKGW